MSLYPIPYVQRLARILRRAGVSIVTDPHTGPLHARVRELSAEIGVDSFQADRSPTHMYRTAPLAGLWAHQKGGFYHDGRFATLLDVVNHYDTQFNLNLSDADKNW
jgi:cytochrome c peroxidase